MSESVVQNDLVKATEDVVDGAPGHTASEIEIERMPNFNNSADVDSTAAQNENSEPEMGIENLNDDEIYVPKKTPEELQLEFAALPTKTTSPDAHRAAYCEYWKENKRDVYFYQRQSQRFTRAPVSRRLKNFLVGETLVI